MNRFLIPVVILVVVTGFFVSTIASSRAQPAVSQQWEYLVVDENGSFYSYDPASQTYSNWLEDEDFAAQVTPITADSPARSHILLGVYNLLGSYGWEWAFTNAELHSTYFKRLKPAVE